MLDNVWGVEVVNAFASTGFHVLVTTRQRTVVSPGHSGLCTKVGDMSEEDALEVLRKASQAHGLLPDEEARQVPVQTNESWYISVAEEIRKIFQPSN